MVAVVLTAVLGTSGVAHAGGPKRLTAALDALKSSQKQLEDAKEPPAAFHEKSLKAVSAAIVAVEKEIKAYNDLEAAAKAKAEAPKPDPKADPKAAKPDPKADPKLAAKPAAKPAPKPAAPKPAAPKASEDQDG